MIVKRLPDGKDIEQLAKVLFDAAKDAGNQPAHVFWDISSQERKPGAEKPTPLDEDEKERFRDLAIQKLGSKELR